MSQETAVQDNASCDCCTLGNDRWSVEHLAMEGSSPVIAVRGELDAVARQRLCSTLWLFGHMFGAVVVDLSGVVCDASTSGALVEVRELLAAERANLILRHAPPALRRLTQITDLVAAPSNPDSATAAIVGGASSLR